MFEYEKYKYYVLSIILVLVKFKIIVRFIIALIDILQHS